MIFIFANTFFYFFFFSLSKITVVVKPQVSVSPQKQIVDIAQRVTFRCSASAGFPAATLRWERGDGRQLPRFSKFVERVGLFKILAASRRDEGEYMCIASNQGGDSIMKVKLLVKGRNSKGDIQTITFLKFEF